VQAQFSANCKQSLLEALDEWGAVAPPREERVGRQDELDRWVLRRFLLGRLELGAVDFPLKVFQGDAPDFILLEDNNLLGVEITQAADAAEQAWMTKAQNSGPVIDIPDEYVSGERLIGLVSEAISNKTKKKETKSMHWVQGLAIYLSTYDDLYLEPEEVLERMKSLQNGKSTFSFVWVVSEKWAIDLKVGKLVHLT
jgi:hypothetical protein